MKGILKKPMKTADALRKDNIALPEEYAGNPDLGIAKLFEQEKITLRQMDGYLSETSQGYTLPKLLLEKAKKYAYTPVAMKIQRWLI
jgi:hypothetical protein